MAENKAPYYLAAHRVLTLIGITGLAGFFLPFVYDYSPVMVMQDPDFGSTGWRWAAPVLLPLFIFPISIYWLIKGALAKPLQVFSYLISLCMGIMMFSWIWEDNVFQHLVTLLDWISFLIPHLTILFGLGLLQRNTRYSHSRSYNPILALQLIYLANSLLFLIGFYRNQYQIGAYLILVTCIAYFIQILLVWFFRKNQTFQKGAEKSDVTDL